MVDHPGHLSACRSAVWTGIQKLAAAKPLWAPQDRSPDVAHQHFFAGIWGLALVHWRSTVGAFDPGLLAADWPLGRYGLEADLQRQSLKGLPGMPSPRKIDLHWMEVKIIQFCTGFDAYLGQKTCII